MADPIPPTATTDSNQKPAPARGRPIRFTAELREQFCTCLRLGCSRAKAASMVGIGRRTVARALRENAEFAQAVRIAQADGASAAVRHIHQAAPSHWRAAAWMLDRQHPKRQRITTVRLLRSPEFKEAVRRLIDQHSPRNQAVELIRQFLSERAKDALAVGPEVDVFDCERFPMLTLDFS